MKVLLVDNGTTLLNKLRSLIPGHEIVHSWDDLEHVRSEDFDLIVLSGGSRFEIVGNEKRLEQEFSLVRNTQKTIIGICYGCEIIAQAFSCKLEKSDKNHNGIIDIQILVPDDLFGGKQNLRVYENHRWLIKELSSDLIGLAKSDHGYEVIKHRSKPIYGFQFHPEQFIESADGDEIFLNLFRHIDRLKFDL